MNWQPVIDWLLQNGTRILIILVVGIVAWILLNKLLPPLIRKTVKRNTAQETEQEEKQREDTLIAVFNGIGRVLIAIIVIFSVLAVLNINITPILASFGAAVVAVGFGAQYLVRDLIAGVFIIMENQYRVNDVVRVSDVAGQVQQINLRKTVLRDLDGIVHHVPNGEIKVASNFTRNFSRVNMNISVSYGTSLDHAISVINRVGAELAKDEKWRDIIINPPQVLRVDNLGDSGIEIKILGDVQPIKQWDVMGELRLRLKNTFDAEGIEIPWPHTKVYFGNQPPIASGITCPACSYINTPDSKFCAKCGISLKA